MISRRFPLATWHAAAVAAALAATATPALASEGPTGTPLPDTLAPVGIPSLPAPASSQPGPRSTNRPARPRIVRARVVPRRVVRGHRSRLVVSLAVPERVRVVLERTHGRRRI